MKLNKKCLECGDTFIIEAVPEDYFNWTNNKVLIQDAFPYLSDGDRELLLSGICNECFDAMFSDED